MKITHCHYSNASTKVLHSRIDYFANIRYTSESRNFEKAIVRCQIKIYNFRGLQKLNSAEQDRSEQQVSIVKQPVSILSVIRTGLIDLVAGVNVSR